MSFVSRASHAIVFVFLAILPFLLRARGGFPVRRDASWGWHGVDRRYDFLPCDGAFGSQILNTTGRNEKRV
jgi:hypothetical protein